MTSVDIKYIIGWHDTVYDRDYCHNCVTADKNNLKPIIFTCCEKNYFTFCDICSKTILDPAIHYNSYKP